MVLKLSKFKHNPTRLPDVDVKHIVALVVHKGCLRVNEALIYIVPTLVIHIGQMLNTNVGPSMKFGTVGPIMDTTIEPILCGNFSAGLQPWHHFDLILFQVTSNVESTLYDNILMLRGNLETILTQHCINT